MQKEGKSWKDKLRAKIGEVMLYSRDFKDFLNKCTECGIEYVYKPSNKVKLKFRLSGEGQQKFTRTDTLGDEYTAEKIAEQIEQIQKAQAVLERLSEKKKPEKPVATAPVTAPKTKPTAEVSAPTTPPSESIHFIADTVLARMREKGITPPTPAPKPTQTVAPPKPVEVKAPEKKEDVWAGIRGMRDSSQVIADLEASGITSLSELRSFFWNIKHNDDHTAELAELDKKIKSVDKLIAMMKQQTDNSATYKEYQDCSAFTQNRYRKKNATAIDSYEEAVKYINKHIKAYYIGGKASKQSELQAMSTELKKEYNALLPEHNAFIRKRDTAQKHTRQVRNYLESKQQQERNRQYQERKRSQQKKKDYLE